jgi:SAM-dependent methyltransferase
VNAKLIFNQDLSLKSFSPATRYSPPATALTRIVSWSHLLLQEVLQPGDLAVDLTAGKGRDTLMLADAVGVGGRVIAFDIQADALDQTAERLRASGREPVFWPQDQAVPEQPGCYLIQGCHTSLQKFVGSGVRAAVANLGYLPGGDPEKITCAATTVVALRQVLQLLCDGGRLAVTVYPAHPGGAEEGEEVSGFLGSLSSDDWQVLQVAVANHSAAPYLLAVEKKR